jgi:hypothetical protein
MPPAVAIRPKRKKKKSPSRRVFKPISPKVLEKEEKRQKSRLRKIMKSKAAQTAEGYTADQITQFAEQVGGKVAEKFTDVMVAPGLTNLAKYGLRKGLKVWKEKKQERTMVDVLARAIGNPRYANAVSEDVLEHMRAYWRQSKKLPPEIEKLFEGNKAWNFFCAHYRVQEIDIMLDAAARAKIKKGLTAKQIMKQRRKLAKEIYEEFLQRYVVDYRKKNPKTNHLKKVENKRKRAKRTSESILNQIGHVAHRRKGAEERMERLEQRQEVFKIVAEPFLTIEERRAKMRKLKEKIKEKKARAPTPKAKAEKVKKVREEYLNRGKAA